MKTAWSFLLVLAVIGLCSCGGDFLDPSGPLPESGLGTGQVRGGGGHYLIQDVFEPNDEPSQAKRLLPNRTLDLSIGADGQDWFYVDYELGSEFIIEIETEQEDVNLDVAVYFHDRENDEYIVRNQGVSPTGKDSAWWVVFLPVRYYVGVTAVDGAVGRYTLKSTVNMPSDTVEKLAPVCGDTHSGFGCFSESCVDADDTTIPGYGNKSFEITVDECSSCPASFRIRARLDVPFETHYELQLLDQDGNLLDVATKNENGFAYVTDAFEGTWGWDNQTYVISILFKGYDTLENCKIPWILDIKGGCPSGW